MTYTRWFLGTFDLLLTPWHSRRVIWSRMCSICAQTSGACRVGGIVIVVLRFRRGKAVPDFGETGLVTVVWPPGLE